MLRPRFPSDAISNAMASVLFASDLLKRFQCRQAKHHDLRPQPAGNCGLQVPAGDFDPGFPAEIGNFGALVQGNGLLQHRVGIRQTPYVHQALAVHVLSRLVGGQELCSSLENIAAASWEPSCPIKAPRFLMVHRFRDQNSSFSGTPLEASFRFPSPGKRDS